MLNYNTQEAKTGGRVVLCLLDGKCWALYGRCSPFTVEMLSKFKIRVHYFVSIIFFICPVNLFALSCSLMMANIIHACTTYNTKKPRQLNNCIYSYLSCNNSWLLKNDRIPSIGPGQIWVAMVRYMICTGSSVIYWNTDWSTYCQLATLSNYIFVHTKVFKNRLLCQPVCTEKPVRESNQTGFYHEIFMLTNKCSFTKLNQK